MTTPADRTGQIPLDLPLEASAAREDLLESPSNSMAVQIIDDWPQWPSNTVVLAGPVGSGKSHLARIWAQLADAGIIAAADLANHQAGDLQGNLVVEDVAAGAIPEEPLFHLFNRLRADGGYLLITSREFPVAWGLELPDLASRLKTAHLVELHEPDDRLLAGAMVKLFADRQISVEPQVIDYLVHRMERSLEAAARIVAWLDREALARRRRITRQFAGEALASLGMV